MSLMLTHPRYPELYLVQPADLREEAPSGEAREHFGLLQTLVTWAEEYLCHSHPELGRSGVVCPYAGPSLRRNLFLISVCSGPDHTQDSIAERVLACRDWFVDIEPRDGADAKLKTLLVLFPDLPENRVPELIEGTHAKLQASFVNCGLMLGEFHPGPPATPGLWNPDFRPLRAPVPLLGIRHMVPTDFPFLQGSRNLVAAYLERHGGHVPPHIFDAVRATAERHDLPSPRMGQAESPGATR